MTALLYLLGVLAFTIAILASIGLHELGHMIPAKKFGGKVTQYFVGFGRTVWSKKVGETEYGIKAIPLGGYVKIVGMLPPDKAHRAKEYDADGNLLVRPSNTGLFQQLVADARDAEWEHIRPEDEPRLFYKLPWWKKVVVMAGGPTVNLLIAFFVFLGVFALYGEKSVEADPGAPVIQTVARCVIPYAESGRECTSDDSPTPAYEAGLRPGDTITSFNGTSVTSWAQMRELIRDNADGEALIGFERDGKAMEGRTNTTVQARPESDTDLALTRVGFLGVSPTTHVVTTKGGPLFTLDRMGEMTVQSLHALATLPVKVWHVGLAVVGVEERALDSPVSVVGGGRIAGEVASTDQISVSDKLVTLAMLVGGFNLFIGLFNFIPLLPLDGGHIAGALYEAVRRGFARLLGRPDPGHVDVARLLPVAYVVGAALLVMGVVLILGDLVAPVQFG